MKSKRMYVIKAAVAVLCLSMWTQSGPVAAIDVALTDSVSGRQQENAAQTHGSTLPPGTPMQTIPSAEGQACDKTRPEGAEAMAGQPREFAQNNCIPRGQKCTVGGSPCCAPYTCTGVYPNYTCQ